ncbi:MAG: MBOAT family protein [Desulfovibrionaceae bacterium]
MIFNSAQFLFVFFPLLLAGYYGLARLAGPRRGPTAALALLLCASLAFYASWRGSMLALLLSLAGNAVLGRAIARTRGTPRGRTLYVLALVFNLSLLGYYKYFGFLEANLAALTGWPLHAAAPTLPLGISFFTFTQIAFLTDLYQRRIEQFRVLNYGTIISFFPPLVAGPILFHHDMLPQLRDPGTFRPDARRFAVGLVLFGMGLVKKVLVADVLAPYADAIFSAVANGGTPDPGQAWRGALLYTLQLYFDFSGYSDMALGLGCALGLRLPLNFFSPYKSANISEFWRRWHISLGYFLMTYLYIPLGGSRKGFGHKLANLMIVMTLCGLWHGAGWTFIAWGALHGIYLVVHNLWRAALGPRLDRLRGASALTAKGLGVLVTFAAVVAGWVLFRAASFHDAWVMLTSMAGLGHGHLANIVRGQSERMILGLLLVCWFAPNSYQLLQAHDPATNVHPRLAALRIPDRLGFRPGAVWALATAVLFVAGVAAMLCVGESPYLYFQF